MPRYRRDSWYEERAMDKYYEYLEEACNCYSYYDDDPVGAEPEEPCDHCKRRAQAAARIAKWRAEEAERERLYREARLAANPDREQITTIKSFLDRVAAIRGEGREAERVEVVREMFNYLLAQPAFLQKHAKFRTAVINKMNELRPNVHAASLLPLFDQMNALLSTAPAASA
jgi:hypothetical protein